MSNGNNAFWSFSLDRYGRAGVPERCLTLQDDGGADVNIALFLLWLGFEGRQVTPTGLDAILGVTAAWTDDAVRPLRTLRRRLKGYADPTDGAIERLRTKIKKVELEAEQIEQDMLFAFARAGADSFSEKVPSGADGVLEHNLIAYVARLPSRSGDLDDVARDLAQLCV